MSTERERNKGTQPLDKILTDLGIQNSDLVLTNPAGLTHKMIKRGRTGRWLTKNTKNKILTALNLHLQRSASPETYVRSDLFNYDER